MNFIYSGSPNPVIVILTRDDQLKAKKGYCFQSYRECKEILESIDFGIEVIYVNGGKNAIKAVKENLNDLDLIFLDMKMEDKHGLIVYEEVRELSDDIIIIFLYCINSNGDIIGF